MSIFQAQDCYSVRAQGRSWLIDRRLRQVSLGAWSQSKGYLSLLMQVWKSAQRDSGRDAAAALQKRRGPTVLRHYLLAMIRSQTVWPRIVAHADIDAFYASKDLLLLGGLTNAESGKLRSTSRWARADGAHPGRALFSVGAQLKLPVGPQPGLYFSTVGPAGKRIQPSPS